MAISTSASLKTIPGPRGLPGLGVLPEMSRDMLGLFMNTAQTYGGIVQLKLLNKNYLLVTNPDYVKYILQDNSRNYIRGRSVKNGRELLGNGLPLIDGELWLRERRMLQPAFHRRHLAKLADTVTGVIEGFIQEWERKARSNQTLDMDEEMMRLTLTVIIKSMFSAQIDEKIPALSHAFNVASRFMLWRSQQMWAPPLSLPVPRNVEYNRALKVLNETIYPLIAEARKHPKDDLLGMMLEMRDADTGEGMTDQQARDEVVTIFFAGHETAAATLTWAFYVLSQHPEIEEQLRAEVNAVLNGRVPTFADLPRLTYMQQVINEVLRLYPAAYLFAREAVVDDVLDGYPIPAGVMIFIRLSSVTAIQSTGRIPNGSTLSGSRPTKRPPGLATCISRSGRALTFALGTTSRSWRCSWSWRGHSSVFASNCYQIIPSGSSPKPLCVPGMG